MTIAPPPSEAPARAGPAGASGPSRRRRGRSRRVRPAQLFDRHGVAVYAVACALTGDESQAVRAVRLGLDDLLGSAEGDRGATPPADGLRAWSRCVYLRTRAEPTSDSTVSSPARGFERFEDLQPLERACVALCLLGGHTRHDVAELLDLPVSTVAELLRVGLAAAGEGDAGPRSA